MNHKKCKENNYKPKFGIAEIAINKVKIKWQEVFAISVNELVSLI